MHLAYIKDWIPFLFLYAAPTEFFSYFPSEVPQFRVISWANLTIQVSLLDPFSFFYVFLVALRPDNVKVALLYFLYLFLKLFISFSVAG